MRNPLAPPVLLRTLLLAVMPALGCAPVLLDDAAEDPDEVTKPSPAAASLDVCIVDAPGGTETLRASEHGVVFSVRTATRSESGVVVRAQRARGQGCDLVPTGPLLAVSAVFDIDDRGDLLARPAATSVPGDVPTLPPDGTSLGSAVRIDIKSAVFEVIDAPRGLDGLGISPQGDAVWVSACPGRGPIGIYASDGGRITLATSPLMATPPLSDGVLRGVLTDARTFWSLGAASCSPEDDLTPSCGGALVRTRPGESVELGSTIVDFGAGHERAQLRRCGASVCGVFPSAVIVWGADGEELMRVTREDLLGGSAEVIVDAAGASRGIYVVLRSDTGSARIAHVARP